MPTPDTPRGAATNRPDTSAKAIRKTLEPFAHFWRQWQRQPMRGLDDEFYCIHTGSEFEASLRRSDCERAAALADALDAAPAVSDTPLLSALTWSERVERALDAERDAIKMKRPARMRMYQVLDAAFPECFNPEDVANDT
jgi:hypothetical protein